MNDHLQVVRQSAQHQVAPELNLDCVENFARLRSKALGGKEENGEHSEQH